MQIDIAQSMGCYIILKITKIVYVFFFFTLFKRILINWIECKTSETLKQGWILILSPDPSTGKPLTRVFHSA